MKRKQMLKVKSHKDKKIHFAMWISAVRQ